MEKDNLWIDPERELSSPEDLPVPVHRYPRSEVSALLLIVGGVYLIWRGVIRARIPVAFIATVAVLTFLFPKAGSSLDWMLYSIFGGGLMLGAFFMATDYATSPVTKKGQLIFGVGCASSPC